MRSAIYSASVACF